MPEDKEYRQRTGAQGTRSREGEAGHNVLLERTMGDTSGSLTVSVKLQRIAEQGSKVVRHRCAETLGTEELDELIAHV